MTVLDAFELDGDVALVTGAASGIGRAYAEAMAEAGADVAVADVDGDGLDETAERVSEAGGEVVTLETDVSDEAAVQAMVETTVADLGGLDVTFANAGVAGEEAVGQSVDEFPMEVWDRVQDVNLRGVMLTDKYAVGAMRDSGGGSIINTASVLGFVATELPGLAPYVSSKGGVVQLTKQLSVELGRAGIRVNAVAPGWIQTDIGGGFLKGEVPGMESLPEEMVERTSLGRLGTPEDLKGVATFLASDASAYCTGSTYVVDGGWTSF